MKRFTMIITIIAALITIGIGFDVTDEPLSATTFGFIGWSVIPYIYLSLMNRKVSEKRAVTLVLIIALLTAAFGVWVFIDAAYIHGNAQSGLVWPVIPLWQLVFLVILTVPVYYLNKRKKELPNH